MRSRGVQRLRRPCAAALLLAGGPLFLSDPATAAQDCGLPVGNVVICDAANEVSPGAYQDADGITYATADLTIQHIGNGLPTEYVKTGDFGGSYGDLVIDSSGAVNQSLGNGPGIAGLFAFTLDGSIRITTTVDADVATAGSDTPGISAISGAAGAAGAITIEAAGSVTTTGLRATGVVADSVGGPVTITVGRVATTGEVSRGIVAGSDGAGADGAISVTANDLVSTLGANATAIDVFSIGGPVTVHTQAITTGGAVSAGIIATSQGGGVNGAVEVIVNGAVSTAGATSTAVSAGSSGGPVTLRTLQTVATLGENSVGIAAGSGGAGADGLVQVTALAAVTTAGDSAKGIEASGFSDLTLEAESVSTAGVDSTAVEAISLGVGDVSVTLHGAVSTLGNGAFGVRAFALAGELALDLQAVTTVGATAHGISAITYDGPLFLHAGAIATQGQDARGVLIDARAAVEVTLASISTQGDGAIGLEAALNGMDDGLTVTIDGPVTTAGDAATGLFLSNGGPEATATIDLTVRGTVRTTGADSNGIRAQSFGGTVTIEAQDVIVTGEDASAVQVDAFAGGATISVANAQGGWGAHAYGASFGAFVLGVDSELTVRSGGSLGALSDQAWIGGNGDETILLYGRMAGGLRPGNGDDTLRILAGGRYDFRNFADSDGDGVRDLSGVASAQFSIGADLLRIEAGGVLALASVEAADIGTFTGLELLENAGLVTMADAQTGGGAPGAGDRLHTQGSYLAAGGALHLDALLDAGGPGAQVTDRFLIDGDASGVTLVTVRNALGQGDATGDGNSDGISVVQVAGTAAANSFQLAGPLVAGAWQYDLVAFDPASSDAGEKDPMLLFGDFWDYRLQSSAFAGVNEYPALAQGTILLGQAALSAALNRPVEPPAIAAPGAPGQSAALGLSDAQQAVRPTAGDGLATGGWLAAFGEGLAVTPGDGADFAQDNYGLQAGYDAFGWRGVVAAEDRLVAGAFGTLAQGSLDFDGSASDADLSLYGGGFYAAYADGGLAVDLVAQLLIGELRFQAPLPGVDADLDVTTLGLGAAARWRFDLADLYLEPGAELRYLHGWMEDGFADASGADIGLDDGDSLVARARLEAGLRFETVAPYLSLGVAHEFLGDTAATASGLGFEASTRGTVLEVGGGVTAWALASNLTLSLEANYRVGDAVQGVSVTGGLKFSW